MGLRGLVHPSQCKLKTVDCRFKFKIQQELYFAAACVQINAAWIQSGLKHMYVEVCFAFHVHISQVFVAAQRIVAKQHLTNSLISIWWDHYCFWFLSEDLDCLLLKVLFVLRKISRLHFVCWTICTILPTFLLFSAAYVIHHGLSWGVRSSRNKSCFSVYEMIVLTSCFCL